MWFVISITGLWFLLQASPVKPLLSVCALMSFGTWPVPAAGIVRNPSFTPLAVLSRVLPSSSPEPLVLMVWPGLPLFCLISNPITLLSDLSVSQDHRSPVTGIIALDPAERRREKTEFLLLLWCVCTYRVVYLVAAELLRMCYPDVEANWGKRGSANRKWKASHRAGRTSSHSSNRLC